MKKAKHAKQSTTQPWLSWLITVIVVALVIFGVTQYNEAQRVSKALDEESVSIIKEASVLGQEAADEAEAWAEAEAQRIAEEQAAQEAISYYSYESYYDPTYDDMSDQEYIAWRESGGNYDARNGQYVGKYQLQEDMLAGDYSPENQEYMAEQYMLDRYGSWEEAREFWDSHGWW